MHDGRRVIYDESSESVFDYNTLCKIYLKVTRRAKINESNCNEFLEPRYLISNSSVCAYLIFVCTPESNQVFSRLLSFADTIHDVFYYFCLYLVYFWRNAEDQSAVERLRSAPLS